MVVAGRLRAGEGDPAHGHRQNLQAGAAQAVQRLPAAACEVVSQLGARRGKALYFQVTPSNFVAEFSKTYGHVIIFGWRCRVAYVKFGTLSRCFNVVVRFALMLPAEPLLLPAAPLVKRPHGVLN